MFGRRDLATLLLATALVAGGCAGLPAQIMSDTRQTIRAAEAAGAEQYAPEPLAQAREGLKRASDLLKQGEYRDSRHEAEAARKNAATALKTAQDHASPPPAPPPGG
jgi:hypothetical protein